MQNIQYNMQIKQEKENTSERKDKYVDNTKEMKAKDYEIHKLAEQAALPRSY